MNVLSTTLPVLHALRIGVIGQVSLLTQSLRGRAEVHISISTLANLPHTSAHVQSLVIDSAQLRSNLQTQLTL